MDRTAEPVVHVIGLGPAGPDLITAGALELIERVPSQFLRTERHPAASVMPDAQWFDRIYDTASSTEHVYRSIREALVRAAQAESEVLYAVPGSPVVAEHSVQLLLADDRVRTIVHPAMSFVDLTWVRLGVDPVARGVTLVDGHRFVDVVNELSGCLLVAQCDSRFVLSDIKVSTDEPLSDSVTVLHHLGLDDEAVFELPWDELDRGFEPDHLSSVWIPRVEPQRAKRRLGRRRR